MAKEQENSENFNALKEATANVTTLKAEVKRLRPFEEQVSNFQVSTFFTLSACFSNFLFDIF